MSGPDGKWIWGEMHPLFEEGGEESLRARQVRVVSRYALTAMLALFVRTLLWVLDGVFYSNPPEIRLYSVGVFLVAGFSLWQILDLKSFARKLFIGVAVLTWGVALVTLIRTYSLPVSEYSPIQIAEYTVFLVWTVVSVLFVLYLLQPQVRASFTSSSHNPYQRTVFALVLVQVLFFEWKSSQGFMNVNVKLGPATPVHETSLGRFQQDCAREEATRLPSSDNQAAVNFCRCDSKVLGARCPTEIAGRDQCLRYIETKLTGNPRGKVAFQESRDACVAQYFPKEQEAMYLKARAALERNVLSRLSVALPLEKIVAGEVAQRKFLYCMTLGLFSRCRDPKPSATQACLVKPVEPKESEILKARCLRLAEAKQADFDKLLGAAESLLAKEKYSEAIASAEKAIASGSDRPEGYLVRGIAYIHTAKHKSGIDDLTIALNVSDFSHTRIRALEARRIAHLNLKDIPSAEVDAKEACALGATALCPLKGAQEPAAWHSSEDVAVALAAAVSEEASQNKLAWSMNASDPVKEAPPVPAEEKRAPTAEDPVAAAESVRAPDAVPAAAPTPESKAVVEKEAAAPEAAAVVSDEKRLAWTELMQVGDVLLKMGDTAKAQEKYQVALKYSESLGEANELWIESSLRMAAFFREAGKLSDGEAYVRNTISFWKQQSEKGQRGIVEEIGRYSLAYQNRREWKLQERLLLEVWKEASETDSLLVREINLQLSGLYQASGRSEKLESFFKREAEIYEKRFGKKSARTGASLQQLSEFYLSQGESKKANAVFASPVSLPEGR